MTIIIKTNNIPRLLKYGYDMPEKIKPDFDYIDPADFPSRSFFVYRGQWYDLGEFIRVYDNKKFTDQGWIAYNAESFFSGILIKFCKGDADKVIIGRYYC